MSELPDQLLLERYLDGQLSPPEFARLQERLREEPKLARQLAQMARMDAELQMRLRQCQTEEVFRPELQRAPPPSRPGRWTRWRSSAVAATLLIVVASAWVIIQHRQPRDQAPLVQKPQSAKPEAPYTLLSGELIPVPQNDAPSRFQVGPHTAVLRLRDGSEAEFRPETQAQIDTGAQRPCIALVQGSGTFRVAKGHGPFRVETQVGSVTALGTEFRVELLPEEPRPDLPRNRRPDRLHVQVDSGIVEVEYGRHRLLMAAGEEETFRDDHEPRPPRELVAQFLSWDAQARRVELTRQKEQAQPYWEKLADEALVSLDGAPCQLSDLQRGMRVKLRFSLGGQAVALEAFGPTIRGTLREVIIEPGRIVLQGKPREDGVVQDKTFVAAPALLSGWHAGQDVVLTLSADESRVVQIEEPRKSEKESR